MTDRIAVAYHTAPVEYDPIMIDFVRDLIDV